MELVDLMKKRFAQRAERIEEITKVSVPLTYRFYVEPTRSEQRYHERFLDGDLSDAHTIAYAGKFIQDLERVRLDLVNYEQEAFRIWEEMKAKGTLPEPKKIYKEVQGEILGMELSASNLGVVLDYSPSMASYLEQLRNTIADTFPDSQFREVWGCYLKALRYEERPTWLYSEPIPNRNPFHPKWFIPAMPTEPAHYAHWRWKKDNVAAIQALILNQEVDSIYWFCDFDDNIDDYALQELGKLVLEHKVRLYVHTSDKYPPKMLRELIDRSGGEFMSKKMY